MFNNLDGKLKTIAKIVLWVGIITTVILAFVLGFDKEYPDYYSYYSNKTRTVFRAGAFFGTLIGGFVSCYISSLILYSLGDIVENTNAIKYRLDKKDKITESKESSDK